MSDLTAGHRYSTMGKWIPLEIISNFGWHRHEAWDRYFFNENFYDKYS